MNDLSLVELIEGLQEVFLQPIPDAEEQQRLVERIAADELTVGQLVLNYHQSDAFQTVAAPVARLYLGVLDRRPDGPGAAFWNATLEGLIASQGLAGLGDLALAFLASAEAQGRFGGDLLDPAAPDYVDDEAFVDQLYTIILGRPGDGEGLAFWRQELVTTFGGRRDLLTIAFTESAEYRSQTEGEVQGALLYLALATVANPPPPIPICPATGISPPLPGPATTWGRWWTGS
ncbi:MAG: DUF4214 domain-containing protein [Candidatus Competibacterales bacterium]